MVIIAKGYTITIILYKVLGSFYFFIVIIHIINSSSIDRAKSFGKTSSKILSAYNIINNWNITALEGQVYKSNSKPIVDITQKGLDGFIILNKEKEEFGSVIRYYSTEFLVWLEVLG